MVYHISIDGVLGAGKTTVSTLLSDIFSSHDNVKFVLEPVQRFSHFHEMNIFHEVANDSTNQNFPLFQIHIMQKLTELLNSLQLSDQDIVVTDRCLSSASVFISTSQKRGILTRFAFEYLNAVHDTEMRKCLLSCPDLVIYLDIDTQTARDRLISRGRGGELEMWTQPNLNLLAEAYNEYCNHLENLGKEVVRVDVNNMSKNDVCNFIVGVIMEKVLMRQQRA